MPNENSKTSKPIKKRLSLELSEDAYKRLSDLAEKTDRNMADVLRMGIALYDIAIEAQENDQSIGVVREKEVMKEILIPKV